MRSVRTPTLAVMGALTGAVAALAVPVDRSAVDRPAPQAPPSPVVRPAPITTLLVWTPGRLPAGFASGVRSLPQVAKATSVRSGTGWLSGWSSADGKHEAPAAGMSVPVEVSAIETRSYAAFVPPADRASVEGLGEGEAILSRSSADLRGLREGGRLLMGAVALRVADVLDDELTGAAEVVVSSRTGRELGISRPRYLLVEPRADANRERVERAIRGLLPPGIRARVRGPGETPVFRHGDAVLPPLRLKQLFGEFAAEPASGGTLRLDPRWVERNIRSAPVPILGEVRCHRLVLPALRSVLTEIDRRGLGGSIDTGQYGGCFSPRFINSEPSSGISHHAWGIAIDVNVSENPLGREPRLDLRIVDAFERAGFAWGGRWLVPDGMHFEFVGPSY